MNGPQHFKEAERLLPIAHDLADQGAQVRADFIVARAQVHATLALAAAQTTVSDDDVMRCAHGAIICGLCGYGVPAGDGGRS